MNEEKPWKGVIIDDPHELLTDEKRKELLAWFEERAKARLGNDREGVKHVMVLSRTLQDRELEFLMSRIKEHEKSRLITTINVPARMIDGPLPLDRFIFATPHPICMSARVYQKFEAMEKEKVDKIKRSNRSPGKTLGKKKWWETR